MLTGSGPRSFHACQPSCTVGCTPCSRISGSRRHDGTGSDRSWSGRSSADCIATNSCRNGGLESDGKREFCGMPCDRSARPRRDPIGSHMPTLRQPLSCQVVRSPIKNINQWGGGLPFHPNHFKPFKPVIYSNPQKTAT